MKQHCTTHWVQPTGELTENFIETMKFALYFKMGKSNYDKSLQQLAINYQNYYKNSETFASRGANGTRIYNLW